jgi:hypothetical protein
MFDDSFEATDRLGAATLMTTQLRAICRADRDGKSRLRLRWETLRFCSRGEALMYRLLARQLRRRYSRLAAADMQRVKVLGAFAGLTAFAMLAALAGSP